MHCKREQLQITLNEWITECFRYRCIQYTVNPVQLIQLSCISSNSTRLIVLCTTEDGSVDYNYNKLDQAYPISLLNVLSFSVFFSLLYQSLVFLLDVTVSHCLYSTHLVLLISVSFHLFLFICTQYMYSIYVSLYILLMCIQISYKVVCQRFLSILL